MKQQSPRQRVRQRDLARKKKARLLAQVEEKDYNWCEAEGCGFTCVQDWAGDLLHFHHQTPRSRDYNDDPTNLVLLCWRCHEKAHGQQ